MPHTPTRLAERLLTILAALSAVLVVLAAAYLFLVLYLIGRI